MEQVLSSLNYQLIKRKRAVERKLSCETVPLLKKKCFLKKYLLWGVRSYHSEKVLSNAEYFFSGKSFFQKVTVLKNMEI